MTFWTLMANVFLVAIAITVIAGLIFGGIVSLMTRRDDNSRAEKLEADNVKLARALERVNAKLECCQTELARTKDELKTYRQERFEANAEKFFGKRA